MNALLQLPIVRTLYARGLLFVVLLIPVVAAVLLAGALEEEPTPAQREEPPAVERSPPGLLSIRPDLEKTPLAYQAEYWDQLAEGAANRLVLIGPDRVPGLVLERGYVLTSATAVAPDAETPPPAIQPANAGGTDAVAEGTPDSPNSTDAPAAPVSTESTSAERDGSGTAGGEATGTDTAAEPVDEAPSESGPGLLGVDWDAGLALFELGDPATASPFEIGDASELHPGAFTAAVTRGTSGRMQLTPGYIAAAGGPAATGGGAPATPDIAIALPEATEVAALIDLDGGLVAAAFQHDGAVDLLTTTQLFDAMARLRERPVCYPIVTADLSDEIYGLLDISNGVAVERVRVQAFRTEAPVRPGDVLLEWNGEAVSSVDQFQELYRGHRTGDIAEFVALRGTRRVAGRLVVPDRHCRPLPEDVATEIPRLGMALVWSPDHSTWAVVRVTPDGPAATAGLRAGDRVLTVNGRELAERNVLRTLDRLILRAPAILFTIERDARVRFLAVTPSDA